MPKITVTTPKLPEGMPEKLARARQDAAYPIIQNREIYTYINEPRYFVNGEEQFDGYINLEVNGPQLDDQTRGALCKALFDVCKELLGERRTLFGYSSTPLNQIGINGLLMPEYKKAKAEGRL